MVRSCGVRWVEMFTAAADEFSNFDPPTPAQNLEKKVSSFIIHEFCMTSETVGLTTRVAMDPQTGESVESVKEISSHSDIFERSLAPFGIYIQNGLLCQLFGGNISGRGITAGGLTGFFTNDPVTGETVSSFITPELSETGEIVGLTTHIAKDPETGESTYIDSLDLNSFLCQLHKLSARGIVTSGRGSFADGFTASVAKDPETCETGYVGSGVILKPTGYDASRAPKKHCSNTVYNSSNAICAPDCSLRSFFKIPGVKEAYIDSLHIKNGASTNSLLCQLSRWKTLMLPYGGFPFFQACGQVRSYHFDPKVGRGIEGCKFCLPKVMCSAEKKECVREPYAKKNKGKIYNADVKGFSCVYCYKRFKKAVGVTDHQKKKHKFIFCQRINKFHRCSKCGNCFLKKADLDSHKCS